MLFPAYFTGFGSKADGSASLRFATQELPDTDFALLKRELNQFGWLAFQANPISLGDMPKEHAEDKNKTPSKRLRAALYVWHEQRGGTTENFEAFYQREMEKLIERVKKQLD